MIYYKNVEDDCYSRPGVLSYANQQRNSQTRDPEVAQEAEQEAEQAFRTALAP